MDIVSLLAVAVNATTSVAPETQPLPSYVGYIGIALAAIFFGSNFIPVKQYETGDGENFKQCFQLCI